MRDIIKKTELKEVKTYEAPGHFGMTAMRLHENEESEAKKFWMGLSHFLPSGGFQEWPPERIEKLWKQLQKYLLGVMKK